MTLASFCRRPFQEVEGEEGGIKYHGPKSRRLSDVLCFPNFAAYLSPRSWGRRESQRYYYCSDNVRILRTGDQRPVTQGGDLAEEILVLENSCCEQTETLRLGPRASRQRVKHKSLTPNLLTSLFPPVRFLRSHSQARACVGAVACLAESLGGFYPTLKIPLLKNAYIQ